MGGPTVPSLGFAMGIERLMLVLKNQGADLPQANTSDLYIAALGDKANLKSAEIASVLRGEGFSVETDICARGLKAQMKFANKIGAKYTMVLGDSEIESDKATFKNMSTGNETEVELSNISDKFMELLTEDALASLEDSVLEQ